MTPGTVATGHADTIGADAMLGMGAAVASGSVVGRGTRVGSGASSGRIVITGNAASGEVVAGSVGTGDTVGTAGARVGRTGAATPGVRGDAVQAMDAISPNARRTSGRMVLYFSPPAKPASLRPPGDERK
jgi:hypothetical protein